MAFPLGTVLTAAPGLISAATDIIRLIKNRHQQDDTAQPDAQKLNEIARLLEKQAELIEELAVNNRNLALAVRNNRILALFSFVIAVIAVIVSI